MPSHAPWIPTDAIATLAASLATLKQAAQRETPDLGPAIFDRPAAGDAERWEAAAERAWLCWLFTPQAEAEATGLPKPQADQIEAACRGTTEQ